MSTRNTVVRDDIRQIVEHDLPWEKLAGCRIVVTGAAGFLGGYIARTLAALYPLGKVNRPIEVIAVVRDAQRAAQRFADVAADPDFRIATWDFNQLSVPDFGAAQYVVHAASQASPRFYSSDPVGTLLPNTVGTAALLEALRRSVEPKGFLFISSSEVYGTVPGDSLLSERDYGVVDPATARACYAESKRMGEAMCVAWHKQYGLPTYIVRPFHTYGPGLLPEDGRVFADFAFNVARNENIVMSSDGSARRAFCYVSDAVAGFFTVMLAGEAGVPYNVANPAGELSVIELAELLVGLFPDKKLSVERRAPTNSAYVQSTYSRLVPDVSRLEQLGWRPHVDPITGFKRMIEALQT